MSEVASLDPQPAAVPTRGGVEPPLRGKPQPGLQGEMLAAFIEVAIKHQKFAAVRKIERNRSVRGPALHPHLSLNSRAISTPSLAWAYLYASA